MSVLGRCRVFPLVLDVAMEMRWVAVIAIETKWSDLADAF
jgi:hypothetical protein